MTLEGPLKGLIVRLSTTPYPIPTPSWIICDLLSLLSNYRVFEEPIFPPSTSCMKEAASYAFNRRHQLCFTNFTQITNRYKMGFEICPRMTQFHKHCYLHNSHKINRKRSQLAKPLGRVRLGSIRNKNNWNNASKRLFGSYSHSGIPGFPFRLFCSQEQNSRNIFRNVFLISEYPKRTRP